MKNKTINLEGVTPQTWGRTIWFFIGLISQLCIVFHLAPLPKEIASLTPEQITIYVTTFMDIWGKVKAWWKNNSFSISAQDGDAVMKSLESGEIPYVKKASQPDTDHHHREVG